MTSAAPLATLTPPPPGRGRWRLTVHNRAYQIGTGGQWQWPAAVYPSQTGVGELVEARNRVITQQWCQPASLSFDIDGHSAGAEMLTELGTDVIAWRWDDTQGADVPIFRGPVCQSQDTLDGQSHSVTFTCHDYLALMSRRYIPNGSPYSQNGDQDNIVWILVQYAAGCSYQSGTAPFTNLFPGSALPVYIAFVNPDGTSRAQGTTGQTRIRTYFGGQGLGAAIDELAKSGPSPANGYATSFDYDLLGRSDLNGWDTLRIWYPQQGVSRSDVALVYGSTVAGIVRQVDSSTYSNYVRLIGNNGQSDPMQPQMFAEAWNADCTTGSPGAVGMWQDSRNDSADVNALATLTQRANGQLGLEGQLVPSYQLTLVPGWYRPGKPSMGDTVPLVIRSGRLKVNQNVRVLGITYTVGDDGNEDVTLAVGRARVSFSELVRTSQSQIDALARR